MYKIIILFIFLFLSCDSKDEYKNGLARIQDYKTKKYGFVDESDNLVIDKIYDWASNFDDGYCVVENKDKRGIINKKGDIVIPLKYDNVQKIENHFKVTNNTWKPNEVVGLINNKNKIIIPLIAKQIKPLPDNCFLVKIKNDNEYWYVYNQEGVKFNLQIRDDFAKKYSFYSSDDYLYDNGFVILRGTYLIDLDEPEASINGSYNYVGIVYKDKNPKKYLFKSIDHPDFGLGNPIIFDYNGNNLLKEGFFTYLNGKYNNGLIAIGMKNLGYGYINKRGDVIIKPIFDDAESFNDGIAKVTLEDNEFYINTKGLCVKDCPSDKWFNYYDFSKNFSTNRERYNKYIDKGLGKVKLGKYDESIDIFTKAIKEYPLDYEAYQNKALSLYENNDMIEAEKEINKAIKLNPEKSDLYYIKGSIVGDNYINNPFGENYINYGDAIDQLLVAININPGKLDYYRKIIYLSGKDDRKEMACYFMNKGCDLGDYDLCNAFKRFCNGVNYYDAIKYIDLHIKYKLNYLKDVKLK